MVVALSSTVAVKFDCTFHIHKHSVIDEVYTCTVTTITLIEITSLDGVTGTHMAGNKDEDVEALWIEGKNIPFIPQGIINYFKKLIALTYIYQ